MSSELVLSVRIDDPKSVAALGWMRSELREMRRDHPYDSDIRRLSRCANHLWNHCLKSETESTGEPCQPPLSDTPPTETGATDTSATTHNEAPAAREATEATGRR